MTELKTSVPIAQKLWEHGLTLVEGLKEKLWLFSNATQSEKLKTDSK